MLPSYQIVLYIIMLEEINMDSGEIALKLHFATFVKYYGLPNTFFDDLQKGDDWSFVIKIHAIFEALVTDLIRVELGRKELADLLARIELSRRPTGKLEIAKCLGALYEKEVKFIRNLSELRNDLVHNIRNVGFDLETYVTKVDKNKVKAISEAFCYKMKEQIEESGKKYSRLEYFRAFPRKTLYAMSQSLLCEVQERRLVKEDPVELLNRIES